MTTGPTFVLVPGMAATAAFWTPVVQELTLRGARSYPVELPGHGFDTQFPEGYQSPQDPAALAGSVSPLAELTLEEYAAHVLAIVTKVAEHGPVVLVGHSLGGNVVTRVANAAQDRLAALVYVCAYCCVDSANVTSYAPATSDEPLARARKIVWIGDPRRTAAMRTNPRNGDPDILDAQHSLLMADLDRARVPAVLNYALQPDEPIRAVIADAQANAATWGQVPRIYIRTTRDEVIPVSVQDRMIAEADALTPGNTFTVHTLHSSHFAPLTQPAQVADCLIATSPA
jgi:pimeloyl-ACP methyl ester carboxylesterase